MRTIHQWIAGPCIALVLAWGASPLLAQGKPADATAQCADGTYSTAKSKSGACSGHGGIKTWYADEKSGVKADAKAAGASTKDAAASAGKATAGAAKVAGKDTKEATAAAGKATANATGAAAKKTEQGAKTAGKATAGAASAVANAIKPKPSDAPADVTGKCKDGSYTKATEHRGACSGHGGVSEWYK